MDSVIIDILPGLINTAMKEMEQTPKVEEVLDFLEHKKEPDPDTDPDPESEFEDEEEEEEDEDGEEEGLDLDLEEEDEASTISAQVILYAIPHEFNSMKAIQYMTPNVQLIDVEQLNEYPDWLRGIPSVLDIQSGRVYEGTFCIKYMREQTRQEKTSTPGNPSSIE
jgi:hypothetical protein